MHCQVAKEVNGPLLRTLAELSGAMDKECVDLLRFGAPLYGVLPLSGTGEGLPENQSEKSKMQNGGRVDDILKCAAANNRRAIERVAVDSSADSVHSATCRDAQMGRMSVPTVHLRYR